MSKIYGVIKIFQEYDHIFLFLNNKYMFIFSRENFETDHNFKFLKKVYEKWRSIEDRLSKIFKKRLMCNTKQLSTY